MRYVTHEFAHAETLDRARRWLRDAGIALDRMMIRRQGVPRLAVVADPHDVDVIEMVIHAAEMSDPDSSPGFWDVAQLECDRPAMVEPLEPDAPHPKPASFMLHWEPIDPGREAEPVSPDLELRKAYGDPWG